MSKSKLPLAVILAAVMTLTGSAGAVAVADSPTTAPATPVPSSTLPSPGAPPPTDQPPSNQPPATQPPATQPPATQPPATQPPSTQPPATQPGATQPPATQPGAQATGPAPAWATAAPLGVSTLGLGGWEVQSAGVTPGTGQDISSPGFDTARWLAVRPDDAGAPGTEINALLQNGVCPGVSMGDNMRRCFGYEAKVGPETVPRFAVPWWYRTDFRADLRAGETARLIVNGIVGQADIWLNGVQVADHHTVTGAYPRTVIDVSGLLRSGPNTVAFEVYPNDPKTMYTLDDIDWNQIPPDNNTGIQFPVQLQVAHGLGLSDVHVLQDDAANLSSSRLTVAAQVDNATGTPMSGELAAAVIPPGDQGTTTVVTQRVTVPARTSEQVTFLPTVYPSLVLDHPQVWWPYQMGAQPLYTLSAGLWTAGPSGTGPSGTGPSGTGPLSDGQPDGTTSEHFGIRTVTSTLVGASPLAPQGVRQFSINDQPFLVRGGGFAPNLFLDYSAADTARQIKLLMGLGVNTIRLEGHQMPADFYDQMDRAGIMVAAGYQCCDKWQPHADAGLTAKDLQILYLSALRLGQDLRDHASVTSFSWSDNAPTRRQEIVSLQGFEQAGFRQPLISSAEYNSSPQLGISGEKEGPYDWVPPAYWYDTTHSQYAQDPTLTNVGGSWGFDSEQSAGDTVPTLDSINRFLTPEEQAALWQDPAYNQYHANYEPGHRGYAFGTLFNFDAALRARYGAWHDLSGYVEEAQVQGYEDARSQFEAFIDHSRHRPTPSTGTIYWQVNKGFPTVLWDLYNSDYDESGTYFGAANANRSLHALWAYDTRSVTIDNLTGTAASGLALEAKVYDLAGHLLDDRHTQGLSVSPQGVLTDVLAPTVPASTAPGAKATTYFVELTLSRAGEQVDRNVYWLSTRDDSVDWTRTVGNPRATMTGYGDLTGLGQLAPATVRVSATTLSGVVDPAGGFGAGPAPVTNDRTTVTVTNTSPTTSVAFFLRADIRRGTAAGVAQPGDDQVLPVAWSDNDITLWPGETQTLRATFDAAQLQGRPPVVSVSGWNVAPMTAAAGR